jgi:hypothetical protein
MSSAIMHSAPSNWRIRQRDGANAESGRMGRARSTPRLSGTPLSDPADILPQMPAQALSPALFELLDMLSGPVLLIHDSPAGEARETAPAMPAAV